MNCGCSIGCDCGCNKNISLGCNSSCNQSYSGIYFCKDPLCYVKTNFVMPAANVVLAIEVTDSSKLYVGQGVRIGDGFVKVAVITDTNNISIVHNGTATPSLQITAVHPSYGCYQYPMLYVGAVDSLIVPVVAGLDASFVVVASSIVTPTMQLTYGYLGPKKVELEFQMDCTIANAPRYVQVNLPVAIVGTPAEATFATIVDNGAGFLPGIGYRRSGTIIVGVNAATALSNGAARKFRVSGFYDVQ